MAERRIVRVKSRRTVTINPGQQVILLQKAKYGELEKMHGKKPDSHNEPVKLVLKISDDEERQVLRVLCKGGQGQLVLNNILLESEFELSHDGIRRTIEFIGTKVDQPGREDRGDYVETERATAPPPELPEEEAPEEEAPEEEVGPSRQKVYTSRFNKNAILEIMSESESGSDENATRELDLLDIV